MGGEISWKFGLKLLMITLRWCACSKVEMHPCHSFYFYLCVRVQWGSLSQRRQPDIKYSDLSEPFCASSLKQSVWFRGFSLSRIILEMVTVCKSTLLKNPQCPRRGEALFGRLLYKTKRRVRGDASALRTIRSRAPKHSESHSNPVRRACVNDAAFFRHSRRQKSFQKLRPNFLVGSCCHVSRRSVTDTNTTTQCHFVSCYNDYVRLPPSHNPAGFWRSAATFHGNG